MHYLEELLAERRLAKRHFARLVGFGSVYAVDKYVKGRNVREDTRERIERGIKVLEIYDVSCPKLNYGKCVSWCDGSTWRRNWGDVNQDYTRYMHNTLEYDQRFIELFEQMAVLGS